MARKSGRTRKGLLWCRCFWNFAITNGDFQVPQITQFSDTKSNQYVEEKNPSSSLGIKFAKRVKDSVQATSEITVLDHWQLGRYTINLTRCYLSGSFCICGSNEIKMKIADKIKVS